MEGHSRRLPSTGRSLALVYLGLAVRHLYLLVLLPFYSRVLGSAAYGRVLAAMSLCQIVWMLVEYGFAADGLREVASARTSDELGHLYARHVRARALLVLPVLAVGALGTLLSVPLREAPVFGLLATLNGLLAAFNMGWYFQALGRFRTSVALEVLGFAINLPSILLAVRGPSDAWRILGTLLVSNVVCTLLAHTLVWRTCQQATSTWRDAWGLVRQAGALFAQRSLTLIVASSSTYIVSAYSSAAEVGIYGGAERIAAVGLTLLQPANQVITSAVSNRVGRGDEATAIRSYMRSAVLALSLTGVALSLGTFLIAEPVVELLLGREFMPTIPILRLLGWMYPFAAFTQAITGYVLIPLHRDRAVLKVTMAGAVLTLAGEIGLVVGYGGHGVALARVAGVVFTSLTFAWLMRSASAWQVVMKRREPPKDLLEAPSTSGLADAPASAHLNQPHASTRSA